MKIETTMTWDEVHDIGHFPATKLFKEFSKLYYQYIKSDQPLPPTLRMALESPEKAVDAKI